ncbi:hypothetical protein Aph01nite_39590 [Acrocarpospora phusangensis]|uniref:Uncharacterized protein n=1 Tax=Acrocarpospora phusangensis TaxID=1070424 RepID=A0A919QAM7_9ACTN|nr:hypothetical protein Aph01nite_39590 [Acrocarpospora phusangensis]
MIPLRGSTIAAMGFFDLQAERNGPFGLDPPPHQGTATVITTTIIITSTVRVASRATNGAAP